MFICTTGKDNFPQIQNSTVLQMNMWKNVFHVFGGSQLSMEHYFPLRKMEDYFPFSHEFPLIVHKVHTVYFFCCVLTLFPSVFCQLLLYSHLPKQWQQFSSCKQSKYWMCLSRCVRYFCCLLFVNPPMPDKTHPVYYSECILQSKLQDN